MKNLYLDVPLLFLYSHVGKPDKYHRHIIKVHYLQVAACRWYKLKRALDQKIEPCSTPHVIDALSEFAFSILITKIAIREIWCVPLDCLINKIQKRHFLIKMLWSIVSNVFCKSIRTIPVRRSKSKPSEILSWRYDKQVLSKIF